MNRRQVCVLGGVTLSLAAGGCLNNSPPGTNTETMTSPSRTDPGETRIRIVSQAEQPEIPVEYTVDVAESLATDDHPARLRVTITNPTDSTVFLGEERAVQFHHVASTDTAIYLHPVDNSWQETPVKPGCWRLTDHVAVPEYYGTISLNASETVHAESFIYGHPHLPEDVCLPGGDHPVVTDGVAGNNEDAIHNDTDTTEFEWGFTLHISN